LPANARRPNFADPAHFTQFIATQAQFIDHSAVEQDVPALSKTWRGWMRALGNRLALAAALATALSAALWLPGCARNDGIGQNEPFGESADAAMDSAIVRGRLSTNAESALPPPPPAAAPPPSEAADAANAVSVTNGLPARYTFVPSLIPPDRDQERYDGQGVAPVKLTASEPVSTFSVDVDTGAYANVRRFLTQGQTPPRAAVRTEEMINYFRYDYALPQDRSTPFSITTDMSTTPWNPATRLLRIGIRGYDLPREERPPANLVFLLDVSGSMESPDKLPLLKTALATLTNQLRPEDRVSIVVYAGAAGLVLEPTSDKAAIRAALQSLEAGGSTAGGAGIRLAYSVARAARIEGGVNRVILATDGDFNVGLIDRDKLVELIESNRDDGITLTTLGFGTGNYNEALMEQAADHGNGNYAYIDSALEAQKVLADEMASTLFTIAKDVKIQVEFNPAEVSQYRLIGYENRALQQEDFDNDKVDAGDIGAGHQVTALYEIVPASAQGWVGARRYAAPPPPADATKAGEFGFVKLRYKLPDQDRSQLIERALPARLIDNAGPPRGDMAFAVAVAAFGQTLRGDTLMNGYGFADIRSLAMRADAPADGGYWREEFVKLTQLAGNEHIDDAD